MAKKKTTEIPENRKIKLVVSVTNDKFDKKNPDIGIEYRFFLVSGYYLDNDDTKHELPSPFAISGNMQKLYKDVEYEVWGKYTEGSNGKMIFRATSVNIVTNPDLESCLKTIPKLFPPGKRPRKNVIEAVYNDYGGENIYDIFTKRPDIISNYKGISARVAHEIAEVGKNNRDIYDIHTYLISIGFNNSQSQNIIDHYRDRDQINKIKQVVQTDPYSLVRIKGVGFIRVDDIAVNMGYYVPFETIIKFNYGNYEYEKLKEHEEIGKLVSRLEKAISHVIKEAEMSGHCYMYETHRSKGKSIVYNVIETLGFRYKIIERVLEMHKINIPRNKFEEIIEDNPKYYKVKNDNDKLVGIFKSVISSIIQFQIQTKQLITVLVPGDQIRLYLPYMYNKEKYIYEKIHQLNGVEVSIDETKIRKKLSELEKTDIKSGKLFKEGLTDEQRDAVIGLCTNRLAILTGGAGVGKTTVLKYVQRMLDWLNRNSDNPIPVEEHIIVTAPTGKAADRASKVIGVQGKTLHSAFEATFDGTFGVNEDNPLDFAILVIDESSMIDIHLMYAVLRGCDLSTRILLVGDRNQIASVGPGYIFGDMINSKQVKTFALTKVFRQGKDSNIKAVAEDILKYNADSFSQRFDFLNKENLYLEKEIVKDRKKWRAYLRENNLEGKYYSFIRKLPVFECPFDNTKLWEEKPEAIGIDIQKMERLNKSIRAKNAERKAKGQPIIPELTIEKILFDKKRGILPSKLPEFYNKKFDYQFIAPIHRGNYGTKHLNNLVQEQMNPFVGQTRQAVIQKDDGPQYFRLKDRVIHTKNNKTLEVFNGETGKIIHLTDNEKNSNKTDIWVAHEGHDQPTQYQEKDAKSELQLAYCLSMHKTQGSEYEVVIMFMTGSQIRNVDKSLFYTAVTRAKKMLILFYDGERENRDGDKMLPSTLEQACRFVNGESRNTSLRDMLQRNTNTGN